MSNNKSTKLPDVSRTRSGQTYSSVAKQMKKPSGPHQGLSASKGTQIQDTPLVEQARIPTPHQNKDSVQPFRAPTPTASIKKAPDPDPRFHSPSTSSIHQDSDVGDVSQLKDPHDNTLIDDQNVEPMSVKDFVLQEFPDEDDADKVIKMFDLVNQAFDAKIAKLGASIAANTRNQSAYQSNLPSGHFYTEEVTPGSPTQVNVRFGPNICGNTFSPHAVTQNVSKDFSSKMDDPDLSISDTSHNQNIPSY